MFCLSRAASQHVRLSIGASSALLAMHWSESTRRRQGAATIAEEQPNISEHQSVIVIGGGIVGLTSAYYLCRSGRYAEIHVVERQNAEALECSFQNGGVINVEAIAPVNSYMSVVGAIKASLQYYFTGAETNTLVTWRALIEPPGLILRWLWHFYGATDEKSIMTNSAKMFQLGSATGPLFYEAVEHLKIDPQKHNFFNTPGLVLLRAEDPEKFVKAKKARFDAVYEKQYVTGDALASIQQETGLIGLEQHQFNVGCVEPNNLTINTRTFAESLMAYLKRNGVRFHLGSHVIDMDAVDGRIKAITLESGKRLAGDAFVIAAGYESVVLLSRLAVQLPLAAVKAYSLHIHNASIAKHLKYAAHMEAGVACLITPYRDTTPCSVRVTGVRDMDGFNFIVRKERVDALMKAAQSFLGTDFDPNKDVDVWAGVMPVSPDDFPLVGKLKSHSNLYLNVGHGFRGTNWSMATSKLLAQVMGNEHNTCIDAECASPERFGL